MEPFPIMVVCEGRSEANYIKHLNRIFQTKNNIQLFTVREANGGATNQLLPVYKGAQKAHRKQTIWVIADKDLYCRSPKEEAKLKKADIPYVFFNYMNFEDMLVLHQDKKQLEMWIKTCKQSNHFKRPLSHTEYQLLYKKQFPDYCKGSDESIPELDREAMERAFLNMKRQSDINSEFLRELKILLDEEKILYKEGI